MKWLNIYMKEIFLAWADNKIASDTSDPWGGAAFNETSNPWAGSQEGQDDNWANFSNAEFVSIPAATSPMDVTESGGSGKGMCCQIP